ncbi:indolepyruvate ferredoxin oxidoreductase family protein [Glacieibacterium frigidum]|uniref:Indolepyruvate ferredoxin oxidoreductase family protein n=2 Tax=Glacieibacterium frigidum TaxID=2593303 RepID=A0A552UJA9_9SPHN|nr:indolepyruvate ferredoxin oxidoreductase family protein [Glacieibacterium frigidum]
MTRTAAAAPRLREVALDDKYTLASGQVYLSGVQALVRLLIDQRQRDRRQGLNTGGFVSGYRGSPLGGLDHELWRAARHLEGSDVVFSPGVNEELAATAVWGTQQVGTFGGATVDGVFSLWYAKGPGVDRSLDALKHANLAGTARHGGVLAVAGDDHISQSSTLAHQSDQTFIAAMIPILNPSSVQEYLDYGMLGIAMSRFSGCWVGFKALAETVESSASISVDPDALAIVMPSDFPAPPGGLHLRWPDPPLAAEARLHGPKMDAVAAFARANALDRIVVGGGRARFGIITTGKSYLDVAQALIELGIDRRSDELGVRVYKVGMSWPLESEGALRFADGLDEILVVEEKQGLIEAQLTHLLYNLPAGRRPRIHGKRNDAGGILLQSESQLSASGVAIAIAKRLAAMAAIDAPIAQRLARIEAFATQPAPAPGALARTPVFCSGCPHSSSTKVPQGSRAHAGIGCHGIATLLPDRATAGFTQMGGEGTNWIGQAPFSTDAHIFQNLGDGTYTHSGLLAIRAAAAAGVNITYKILYNDAVAMTGGQPAEGQFSVAQVVRQVQAEGVARVDVVSDNPDWHRRSDLPADVKVHHRDDLDAVQRTLRDVPGTTILVYEQTCATEKRRRRKRGTLADPAVRVFINPDVCEGCGDCSEASSCVSVVPLDTDLGRKRAIAQSSCNKDLSCTKGFCPSFIVVEGGTLRGTRRTGVAAEPPEVPEPATRPLNRPYNILVAGVGGTGVVTIGALLGMAAHIEGRGCTVSDFTGLAQKGGAVTSHVRLAPRPDDLHAVRIAPGNVDLMLAYDPIVATAPEALATLEDGVSHVIANDHVIPTGAFLGQPDLDLGRRPMLARLEALVGGKLSVIDAARRAEALVGDAIGANAFMLGFAFQRGLIPLSLDAIERAVILNGAAVGMNRAAFAWGRAEAHDPAAVARAVDAPANLPPQAETAQGVIDHRADLLGRYQDAAYAARFRALAETARAAENVAVPGSERFTIAVAKSLAKLMAYKDEYEVARLHVESGFQSGVLAQFEGTPRISYSFAPPLFARRDPATGELRKQRFGPWMTPLLKLLAKGRRLRGTPFDPFGGMTDRRLERRMIEDYIAEVETLAARLRPDTLDTATAIAALPLRIRGYGHVKDRNHAAALLERERLYAQLDPTPALPIAA